MCMIRTNKNLVLWPNIYAEALEHCLLSYRLSNFKLSISFVKYEKNDENEFNVFTNEIGSCFSDVLVGGRKDMCMHTFH